MSLATLKHAPGEHETVVAHKIVEPVQSASISEDESPSDSGTSAEPDVPSKGLVNAPDLPNVGNAPVNRIGSQSAPPVSHCAIEGGKSPEKSSLFDNKSSNARGASPPSHTRTRSWTTLLFKGLRSKSLASSDELKSLDVSPSLTPASSLEEPVPSGALLPGGGAGLRNVGNSCFINTALQCLRWSPGFTLSLVPDLMERCKGCCDAIPLSPVGEGLDIHAAALARASNGDHPMEIDDTRREYADGEETSDTVSTLYREGKGQKPETGALAKALSTVVAELFTSPASACVDPSPFLHVLRRVPDADELLNGGQHDCQELLVMLLHALHEDLIQQNKQCESASVEETLKVSGEGGENPSKQNECCAKDSVVSQEERKNFENETQKAAHQWTLHMSQNSSLVTRLFAGQLQSAVTCSKCQSRFTMYEPFFNISLPLVKEATKNGSWLKPSFLGSHSATTIFDCLAAFVSEEKLEGEEAFYCETCKENTGASKVLQFYKLPPVMLVSLNRFKHKANGTTDKVTGVVSFPLEGVSFAPYLSPECQQQQDECVYDVVGVVNHYGGVTGGHYQAFCRTSQAAMTLEELETMWRHSPQDNLVGTVPPAVQAVWTCYDDDKVTKIAHPQKQIVSEHAYMLVLARRHPTKHTVTANVTAGKGKHSKKWGSAGDALTLS